MRKSDKEILLNFLEQNKRNMEFSTHNELFYLILALSRKKDIRKTEEKKLIKKYK